MVIKHKNIFTTESAWSDADKQMLCLDTGGWRTERPVLDQTKCNYCGDSLIAFTFNDNIDCRT